MPHFCVNKAKAGNDKKRHKKKGKMIFAFFLPICRLWYKADLSALSAVAAAVNADSIFRTRRWEHELKSKYY